jgi:predicted nucleic acid-binding protein
MNSAESCRNFRAKGRPNPTADAQIAAIARLHQFTVLSGHEHFWFVERLRVEDWLGA